MTSSSCVSSKPIEFARILPEWRGKIAVCAGSGPSLSAVDLLDCNDRGVKLIAVNDAIRLTWTWADVLYAPDGKWLKMAPDEAFHSRRIFTLDPAAQSYQRYQYHPIELLNYSSGAGLSLDPTTVRTGGHGGYQAINLAAHFRPRRIVLLGYDMCPAPDGRHHFFGDHPDGSHVNYEYKIGLYHSLVVPLADLGIEIVNASRVSAITAFPRVSLADALAD